MSAQNIFVCLFRIPLIIITLASKASLFMDILNSLKVLLIFNFTIAWMRDKESIVCVSGRMGLWLEKGIEVPKRTLNITV